ncbi:MAG: hypothetical protein KDK66_07495 [Deltaproteobacteria bacterium]|nr:hypothetical protein [Deltaproteobacteria bacterium]
MSTQAIQKSNSSFSIFSSLFKNKPELKEVPQKAFQGEPSSKSQLQSVEARKKMNPNQVLAGKESDPAVQALLGLVDTVKEKVSKFLEPRFDAKDLYDPSGNPKGSDINQDALGDCYFVATLGAIADQQPDQIKNAIQYEEKSGKFTVTLNEKNSWWLGGDKGRQTQVEVSQLDLLRNLEKGGGSTVDNNPGTDGPIWPAVMETAFAKLNNEDWEKDWSKGKKDGFEPIAHGGYQEDAMFAVTGNKGEWLKVGSSEKEMNEAYDKINQALSNGQAVTLGTKKEYKDFWSFLTGKTVPQDGLQDRHAYQLQTIRRDSNNEIFIKVRNPWAHNKNIGEGLDNNNAVVEVKLKTLVNTEGLGGINIGPKMGK